MPRKCKYACNSCGYETTYDVPDFEGDVFNYADNHNLPCGQCGQTAGKNFTGET